MRAWAQALESCAARRKSVLAAFFSGSKEVLPWPVAAPRVKDASAVSPKGVCMTRAEFLEAASDRLSEAIILLTAAGEDCLAFEVEAIADRVEFRAVPVAVKKRAVDLER